MFKVPMKMVFAGSAQDLAQLGGRTSHMIRLRSDHHQPRAVLPPFTFKITDSTVSRPTRI
jgi:hypothetical protein